MRLTYQVRTLSSIEVTAAEDIETLLLAKLKKAELKRKDAEVKNLGVGSGALL